MIADPEGVSEEEVSRVLEIISELTLMLAQDAREYHVKQIEKALSEGDTDE